MVINLVTGGFGVRAAKRHGEQFRFCCSVHTADPDTEPINSHRSPRRGTMATLLLPEHDEEHATLEAAFAFLDSCDANSATACVTEALDTNLLAGTLICGSPEPAPSTDGSETDTVGAKKKNKSAIQQMHGKPACRPVASPVARRARKLNKAVILELHAHVEQLKLQLVELKDKRQAAAPTLLLQQHPGRNETSARSDAVQEAKRCSVTTRGSARDLEAVLREFRRLKDATRLNSALKSAWVAQSRLADELRVIMAKQVVIAVRDRPHRAICGGESVVVLPRYRV